MFFQPRDMKEALRIRADLGADVVPIAGGTDIVAALNRDVARPEHFLDLTQIEGYSDILHNNGAWTVSAGATFAQLASLPIRALADAAMTVGGPAIRNRATLGGNLGTASPAGDGCVALLSLNAQIEIAHASRGSRRMPLEAFITGYRQTALQPDELITAVHFPDQWRSAWYAIGRRGSMNISLVCCAITLSPDEEIRIAFGCVGPTVMRSKSAETILGREGLSDETIAAAASAAMQDLSPTDDYRGSAAYKLAMCGVLTRRLLNEVRVGS